MLQPLSPRQPNSVVFAIRINVIHAVVYSHFLPQRMSITHANLAWKIPVVSMVIISVISSTVWTLIDLLVNQTSHI